MTIGGRRTRPRSVPVVPGGARRNPATRIAGPAAGLGSFVTFWLPWPLGRGRCSGNAVGAVALERLTNDLSTVRDLCLSYEPDASARE